METSDLLEIFVVFYLYKRCCGYSHRYGIYLPMGIRMLPHKPFPCIHFIQYHHQGIKADEIRYPMRHLNQLIKEDTEFFIACQKLDANSSIAATK
jgi:hypothetical protein